MVIRILSFLDPQYFVFCGRKNIILADYLIDDNPKQLEIFEGNQLCLLLLIMLMNIDLNA